MQTNSKERKAHYNNNNNNKSNSTMDNYTFDREALNVALKSSSLLLWIPYTLAALYVTWCASFVILPTEFFAHYAHLFTDALSIPNKSHSHFTLNETNNLTHIRDYAPVSSPTSSSSLPSPSSLSSLLLLLRRQHPPRELLQLYNSLLIPLLTSPSTESIRKLYALAHNPLSEPNTFSFASSNTDELAQWCTFDWLFWFASCLSVIAFSLVAVGSTYWCAVKLSNKGGEFLMVIAWVLGVVSEQWWLTSTQHHRYYHNHINFSHSHNNYNNTIYTPSNYENNYNKYNNILLNNNYSGLFQPTCSTSQDSFSLFSPPAEEFTSSIPTFANYEHHHHYPFSQFVFRTVPTPPSWLWLVVSMCTGLSSGILCKVKDIVDGKQDRNSRLSRWIHRRRAKRPYHAHLHSHASHSIHEHKQKHVNIDNNDNNNNGAITRESNSRSLPLPNHNSSSNATTTTSSTTATKPLEILSSSSELLEHPQHPHSSKESSSTPSTFPSAISASSTSSSFPQHHNTFTVTNTTNSALRERKNSEQQQQQQQQQHSNKYEEEAHQETHTQVAQAFAPAESFSFAPNSNTNKNNYDRANTNNNANTEVNAQVSEKDAVHFTEEPFSPFHPIRRVRLHRSTGLGERLYMVVPFCTGQWFYFITHHGWRGVIIENGIIVLSLAMVGYTMLSFKLLKKQVLKALLRPTLTATSETDEHATEIYSYNDNETANNAQNNIINYQNDDSTNHLYSRPMIHSRSSSTANIISTSTNTNNTINKDVHDDDNSIINNKDDKNGNNKMESTEANNSKESKEKHNENNDDVKEENEEEKEIDVHRDNSKDEIKEKNTPENIVENATTINNINNLNTTTSKENLSSSPVIISASEANRMTQHRRRHRSNHKNNNFDNNKIERERNSELFAANVKRSNAIDRDALEDSSESNDDDDDDSDDANSYHGVDDEDDESEDNAELKNVEEKLVFDIIEIIFKLFTTSFGVVVLSVIAANIFLTTLAIPFIKALFSLNALVSSVGIIVELIIYDAV